MIFDVTDEILDVCEAAVRESDEQKRSRQAAGESLSSNQKGKAVLVTCRGVGNINAETVLSRSRDLRTLFNILEPKKGDEVYAWTIPVDNIRPTLNWSGRWGPKDDAMLLVGAYLYGFGNWEAMQKDDKLNLAGKFFLEEGKKGEDSASRPIPNAIHLVRRGDYLLTILREHEEKFKTFESTIRKHGVKRSMSPPMLTGSTSYSGSSKKRAESEAMASVGDGSSKKRKRRPTPTFTDSESSDEW